MKRVLIWRESMGFGGSWSLDSTGRFEKMEAGLNPRAIDFAKLANRL